MINSATSKVNFQDAFPFYRDMYQLKIECIRASEQARSDDIKTVIIYYKKIKNLFKYVNAYLQDNRDIKVEPLYTMLLKTIRNDLKGEYAFNAIYTKNNNTPELKKQKERLNTLLEKMEEIEVQLYMLIKKAHLEVPVKRSDPSNSIMQSDLF
jgi:stress response protein YsnF